ncbi:MAG: ABC transporter substrate-binding protein [Gammaproteobacteria bacterium]
MGTCRSLIASVNALTLLVVALVHLSGNAIAADDSDTLRIRLIAELTNIDPAFWENQGDLWVMEAVLPKLVIYKPGTEWEWEPHAAESIEQVDDKTIEFKLREGIQWTNGYGELTADDVKYSFERYLNKELNSPIAGNFALLDNVEITGKYAGKIHFKEPFAGVWGFVLPYASGHLVSKKAMAKKEGGRYGIDIPTTAGPFKIEKHVPKQKIVLVRDDNWPGAKPAFNRIEALPMSDAKAAKNAMMGQLDWAVISLSAVPSLKEETPEDMQLEVRPTSNYFWLGLNMTSPDLADIRVRKAIQLAIDRDAIVDGAFFGEAEVSSGLASKGMLGYPGVNRIERDLYKARALLKEAGVEGLKLELEVVTETDEVTAAQIIQANLAEIGIYVQINTHEGGAFWSLGDEKGKELQLTLKEFSAPPDVNWSSQWFLPEQAGIWNWEYYDDAEFVKLHHASMAEMDRDKRHQLLIDMQKRMDQTAAYVWITHPPRPVLYDVQKVVPQMMPNGAPRLDLFQKAN